MNSEIRGTAGALRNKIVKHHGAVDMAMATFQGEMEVARKEAARFKDEENELRERQAKAASAARAKIAEADKDLIDSVRHYTGKLQGFVAEHITERPPRDFIDNLRIFKDFDLEMERGELDGLILAAQGNYTALRALSSTAKQCGGWDVSAPSTDAYHQQIAQFRRYLEAPIQYCSSEYLSEGCKIYDKKYYMREDGTKYTYGQPMDSVFLLMGATEDKKILEQLEVMGDTWSASFVPQVDKLYPIKEKNADGEEITVSPEEQHQRNIEAAAAQVQVKDTDALQFARKLGEKRNKAAKESAHIREAYAKQ